VVVSLHQIVKNARAGVIANVCANAMVISSSRIGSTITARRESCMTSWPWKGHPLKYCIETG
jgi:hypothetical protein